MRTPEEWDVSLAALLDKGGVFELLGPDREQDFDELAELAASVCSSQIGLVSLIDEDTVYFKGAAGMDIGQVALSDTFCAQTMKQEGILVIQDALRESRFAENPYVSGYPHTRFYAGTPIYSPQGNKIGVLCVLDTIPRELKQGQAHALQLVARQVNAHMELAARRQRMIPEAGAVPALGAMFISIAEALPSPCYVKNREGRLLFYNRAFAERMGVSRDAWLEKRCAEMAVDMTARVLGKATEHAFRLGRYVESDVEVVSTDGELARWRLCQSPCCGPDGESLLAAVAVELEPTHRKVWEPSA